MDTTDNGYTPDSWTKPPALQTLGKPKPDWDKVYKQSKKTKQKDQSNPDKQLKYLKTISLGISIIVFYLLFFR